MKLHKGLVFIGIWQTQLKFIFNNIINQKGAAEKMVQYFMQNDRINNILCTNMSKMIFGSNDNT